MSPDWIVQFPLLKISSLKRGLSDHCPLLLHPQARNWGPTLFRFLNCWLSDLKCLKITKKSWSRAASFPFEGKLKEVKKGRVLWNENEFGDINSNITRVEQLIRHFDNIADTRNLDEDELKKERRPRSIFGYRSREERLIERKTRAYNGWKKGT